MKISMKNYTHKRPLCGHCAPSLQKPGQSVCAFSLTSWGFMKKIMCRLLLAAAPCILFTLGCTPHEKSSATEFNKETIPGGHISRTRTDVPHKVESTALSAFFISFYFKDPYMPERSDQCSFELEKENGE